MSPDELRDFLADRGVNFKQEEIQNGYLFRCEEGEKFAAYNTGRVVCQGKHTELSKAVKDWKKPTKAAASKPKEAVAAAVAIPKDKPVFIAHAILCNVGL